jgi:hypothetical protein
MYREASLELRIKIETIKHQWNHCRHSEVMLAPTEGGHDHKSGQLAYPEPGQPTLDPLGAPFAGLHRDCQDVFGNAELLEMTAMFGLMQ